MEILIISILAIAIICSCLASALIYIVFIRQPRNRIVPIPPIPPIARIPPMVVPIVPSIPIIAIDILEPPKIDDPCNNI